MAHDLQIKGAYPPLEYADEIESLRHTGLQPGLSIGWAAFDKFYTIPRSQWSVVTGLSSSGKSTWLDNVMVKLGQLHNWKFLICSPENQPIRRHIASLMEIYAGRKFGRPSTELLHVPVGAYMTDTQYREAFQFVCEHFYFINPPETEFTVTGIIDLSQKVYDDKFKFDGMVLDPYNEIEHKRPAGMSETDYVSQVLALFRQFTRRLDIHFWFVAHPTKPKRIAVRYQQSDLDKAETRKPQYERIGLFDISGSAHWKSKCDFGVIVHRDLNDLSSPSTIEVEKVRFRENGEPGELLMYYDYLCNRFVERYGELLINQL